MEKIVHLGLLAPHTCPREGARQAGLWSRGQFSLWMPPAQGSRCITEWLLYLVFSYLFGTWLAAVQSKRDSVGRKDSRLGH